jgi:DedD protein
MDIPPRENAPPLPAPVASPPEKAPAPVVTPVPVEEPKKAPPPKVAKVEPKSDPKTKVAAATPAVAAKEGFAVQVGAFADDGHMQQVKGKLALENIVVYSEKTGSLTRLRVGPFPTRDAAEKSLSDVKKVVPDAKVVSLP